MNLVARRVCSVDPQIFTLPLHREVGILFQAFRRNVVRGQPVPRGSGTAVHRRRNAGVGLPAERGGVRAHGDGHHEHVGAGRQPQRGECRGPAGRHRGGVGGGQRAWHQRQDRDRRGDGDEPPARGPAAARGVKPEGEQRGGGAVGDDGEPVGDHRHRDREGLQPVPRQQTPSCSRPSASRVPPRESTDSTANVTAVARTGR